MHWKSIFNLINFSISSTKIGRAALGIGPLGTAYQYMKRERENNLDLLQMHTFGDNNLDTDTKIFILKNL